MQVTRRTLIASQSLFCYQTTFKSTTKSPRTRQKRLDREEFAGRRSKTTWRWRASPRPSLRHLCRRDAQHTHAAEQRDAAVAVAPALRLHAAAAQHAAVMSRAPLIPHFSAIAPLLSQLAPLFSQVSESSDTCAQRVCPRLRSPRV